MLRADVGQSWGISPEFLVASEVSIRSVVVTSRPPDSAAAAPPPRYEVGLDQVRDISGGLSPLFRTLRPVATDLWRARIRLERGDLHGAEPLFEKHARTYAGLEGPTAQALFGGLLLCRLARGAQVLSLDPWLYYVQSLDASGAPARTILRGGESSDPSELIVIDSQTQLCPALPPIWLNSPALRVAPRRSVPLSGRAAKLAMLYDASCRIEIPGGGPSDLGPVPTDDFSLTLCWHIVTSRAGDATSRKRSRDALGEILLSQPLPWVQAWCRVAIGRSLTLEADEESRLLGVAELLTVPSVFAFASPYLTGVAYVQASVTLSELGDIAGAASVAAAFSKAMPGHPAGQWEPFAVRFGRSVEANPPSSPSPLIGEKPSSENISDSPSQEALPGGVR
jgi:hypothetical protein